VSLVSANLLKGLLVRQKALPTHPLEIALHRLPRLLLDDDVPPDRVGGTSRRSSGSSSVVLAVVSIPARTTGRLHLSKQELVELALHPGLYYAGLNRRLVPQQVELRPSS
jgi:hypothetical protein